LKLIEIDAENQDVKCGMPQMTMLFFGIAMTFILLIAMIIQLVFRKITKRKHN